MRRSSKIFLLLCIIFAPVLAWAEMITGTVVAIDREQNSFVLHLDNKHTVQIKKLHSPLPGRMKPGRQIRIWGSYNPAGTIFEATDIRGAGNNRHHDQTGVRARFGNGKYCPKGQDSSWKPRHNRHLNTIPAAKQESSQP